MFYRNRCAKINVKLLVILLLVTAALGVSLVAARQIRRSILSKMSLEVGTAAFESKDWLAASKNLQEYLGRNPDDVEILRKYAKARLAIRPLEAGNVMQAIAAYRRIGQLAPLDETTYDELATLYAGIGNFDDLAYMARTRLERDPNDRNSPLWLADALIRMNKREEARQVLRKLIERLDALPDKHAEYVEACVWMSSIGDGEGSPGAKREALEWLHRAVKYLPESAEALAHRARFYYRTADIAGVNEADRPALAREDLEAADALGTEDPKIRYSMGAEWLAHGELDRAAAELQAVDKLPEETLEKHFFDIDDWKAARFLFASELATRRGNMTEAISLADGALAALKEKRHRIQVLPTAIMLYVAASKVAEARSCLNEYMDTTRTLEGSTQAAWRLAYLQALVAKVEEKLYTVIDVLQPFALSDVSRPELWRLLAEAYSRTDQTRRAVSAMIQYLRYRPRDPEMTLQLAKEYLKLRDWSRALETARLAEPLNPTDIIIRLLRIEASVYMAAEERQTVDTVRLHELSAELATLRQEHPDRVDIRILQAAIANYLKQPDKAEDELKLAIEECKEPLRAEMQLVTHYLRMKRMADAIRVCETSCQRHPAVAEPWLSLSGLHGINGDNASARACLRQGLNAAVGKWEKRSLSTRLGMLEVMYGDRGIGIRILRELAAQDEYEIYARSLLLNIREIQEDRATAERLVKELRQAEGESGLQWRLHQASLWLSSDQWRSKQQDITDQLQYCIDADPEWSAPVLLLVDMHERMEDFRRVEDLCRQALARNPSATDITDKLLALLEKQGRFSDAEEVLQRVETDARLASAWHERMALRAGDFSRAIDELKLRVSNNDQDVGSRIRLARLIYWQTKDADEAFKYLKEAEAITPGAQTLTAVRASILRAEGRMEEAQRVLDDYVAQHNDFNAYWMRAVYLAEARELQRAESDYKKLTTFPEQGAAGYMLLSNFYAGNKQLDTAVVILEEGLKAYPEHLGLKQRLMQMLFGRGQAQDRERALGILAALETRLPQDPGLMKVRAVQMLKEQTPESRATAQAKLENAVKLEPTAVDGHLMLIGMAMQEGQFERARDLAIRALGSNPNDLALLMARGRAELALANPRMAVELAYLALQRDPNSTDAMAVLVEAAVDSNDGGLLDDARARIESAVHRNRENEALLILRSRFLVSLGQPQKAIPELEGYCQTAKGSTSITAVSTLADLYRLSGDMDKSEREIERIERIDPNGQTGVHARFLWLVSQNRLEELAHISSTYLAAKEQNPAMLLAAASRLSAFDSVELKREGLRLFERAVTLDPTSVSARAGQASTLYQTGNAERAKEVYQELLKQHPNDTRVLNDFAWVLQEHDHNYDAALELANKGLSTAPNDLHLLDTRGTILARMADRLADARSDFRKLVELSPPATDRKARALLQLGRVCARLNDVAEAKQHLRNALEIDQKINVFTPDERSEITRITQ